MDYGTRFTLTHCVLMKRNNPKRRKNGNRFSQDIPPFLGLWQQYPEKGSQHIMIQPPLYGF
jgi:hypothetical protein